MSYWWILVGNDVKYFIQINVINWKNVRDYFWQKTKRNYVRKLLIKSSLLQPACLQNEKFWPNVSLDFCC